MRKERTSKFKVLSCLASNHLWGCICLYIRCSAGAEKEATLKMPSFLGTWQGRFNRDQTIPLREISRDLHLITNTHRYNLGSNLTPSDKATILHGYMDDR